MKNFWRSGEPFVWLTGGALALSLIMVAGLVFLVMANGLGFFWPSPIVRLTLAIAQIVYTVTQQPGVTGVTFTIAGKAVEVPTAAGAQVPGPVSRADYLPQAPLP